MKQFKQTLQYKAIEFMSWLKTAILKYLNTNYKISSNNVSENMFPWKDNISDLYKSQ